MLSLDDAVTLLLQLGPEDRDELARLREALMDLAFGNEVPIDVQPLVAKAVRVLGPLADGSAADPAAAFADVSAILEAVMERSGPDSPPAVAEVAEDPPLDTLPADLDVELLRDFLVESRDGVAASEAALLALERAPDDAEAVNTVFRAFHTVKGTAAFLGLARLSAFAHEAESLLARVRERAIPYDRGCAELALRAVDMLKALLDAVDDALGAGGPGSPGGALALPAGYAALAAALPRHAPGAAPALAPVPAAAPAPAPAVPNVTEPAPAAEHVERRQGERRQGDRRQGERRAGADEAASVRVRTDRLDRLVDLVGELVIAQSMIAGDDALAGALATHHALAKKVAHAGKIVRELQDLSMAMRMVPLKPTFQKLARLVRDVAAKLGKDVELLTAGEETEVDRTMADVVGDPLVHMVRNALDHGLETPAEREAAGKPRRGRVTLAASHAGGSVLLELTDDGRGLSRERIARKAVERGLLESDRGMTDAEVYQLIFAPGFSTAEQVTDVSGRGVGMDVVKRNIESVRGRVEITSTPGAGTTFSVRLPLTLAVTDGMLVRVGRERYVVPLTNIHLSFRPEAAALQTVGGRGEVVTLRGETMPVVRLHRLFGVAGAAEDPSAALLMIVGDGRRRRSALLVDELLGQQQVVAKGLGDGLARVRGVAGGAILGDGRVGLILDVPELCALAESGEGVLPRPAAA